MPRLGAYCPAFLASEVDDIPRTAMHLRRLAANKTTTSTSLHTSLRRRRARSATCLHRKKMTSMTKNHQARFLRSLLKPALTASCSLRKRKRKLRLKREWTSRARSTCPTWSQSVPLCFVSLTPSHEGLARDPTVHGWRHLDIGRPAFRGLLQPALAFVRVHSPRAALPAHARHLTPNCVSHRQRHPPEPPNHPGALCRSESSP